MANPLDPSALISALPSLLPEPAPVIPSAPAALAALLHSALTALQFRLVSHTDTPLSPPPPSNTLLAPWAAHDPESFTLLYKHPRSSLTYLFKLVKLADKLLIHARALEAPQTASLDLVIADWTSASFFPWDRERDAGEKPLVHGFISSARVEDLVSLFKVSLIGKVAPGLEKAGYEADTPSSSSSSSSSSAPPPSRTPGPAPRAPPPSQPFQLPPRTPYPYPSNPLSIGQSDLLPPGFPPSNPFAPPSLFDPEAGGMLVGPSHPMFAGRGGVGGIEGGRRWGGDGWLPPLGAPPGARFDPVGPMQGPGGRLRDLRGGGGMGGRGGGRWMPGMGGEPDPDDFLPPGMENEGGDMPPGMRDMFS